MAIFSDTKTLKDHERTHTTNKPTFQEGRWECYLCEISFNERDVMEKHLLTHLDEKPFKCNLCLKNDKTSGELGADV